VGLLHAAPGHDGPATGVATTDADPGGVVGVTGFEGVIDLDPGDVTVFQVPPVRTGLPGSSESLRADAAPPAARSGLRPDVGAGLAPLAGLLDRLVVRRGVGVDDEPREF